MLAKGYTSNLNPNNTYTSPNSNANSIRENSITRSYNNTVLVFNKDNNIQKQQRVSMTASTSKLKLKSQKNLDECEHNGNMVQKQVLDEFSNMMENNLNMDKGPQIIPNKSKTNINNTSL